MGSAPFSSLLLVIGVTLYAVVTTASKFDDLTQRVKALEEMQQVAAD